MKLSLGLIVLAFFIFFALHNSHTVYMHIPFTEIVLETRLFIAIYVAIKLGMIVIYVYFKIRSAKARRKQHQLEQQVEYLSKEISGLRIESKITHTHDLTP
jgi:uncharacterized integral membrane protein